ncbi:MAG: Imm40 family immunity protein [Abditibacteriaceae bacterium]
MAIYKEIECLLTEQGYSLSAIGASGFALKRNDALKLISLLEEIPTAILGGDVYFLKEGQLEVSYDNWYCNKLPDENYLNYVNRTHIIARNYIKNYRLMLDVTPIFDMTI